MVYNIAESKATFTVCVNYKRLQFYWLAWVKVK